MDEKADAYSGKRIQMVSRQIEARGILDMRVLQAMRKVERHRFVGPANRLFAYEDYPLGIGHHQTISQPYIVAYMTEALTLSPDDRVLEIGTGSGYQAAVLAELAKEVFSVEAVPQLAEAARERLEALGYARVQVRRGDGRKGWPEHQPYDAVMITAAAASIPQELFKQLKTGGRLIAPVGGREQELVLFHKAEKGVEAKPLLPVSFVPLY